MNSPFEVHFQIERSCALRCRHCSSYLIRNDDKRGYSITDMVQLIQLLNRYSVHVFLTGGEPLLSEDLDSLIGRLSRHSVETHVGLFTTGIIMENGSLVPISEARVAQLRALGLEARYVSVYSAEPSVHDRMTGTASSHLLSHTAMANLMVESIDIRFNSVIFSQNEGEIQDLIDDAEAIGASELRLLKLINHGNASKHWEELRPAKRAHRDILSEWIAQKGPSPNITVSGQPQLAPCRPFPGSKGCEAGIRLLYVTYLGDVYPCACTKSRPKHRICHVSDLNSLRAYLHSIKDTYRQHCMSTAEDCLETDPAI